jgi:hypothetical protein
MSVTVTPTRPAYLHQVWEIMIKNIATNTINRGLLEKLIVVLLV